MLIFLGGSDSIFQNESLPLEESPSLEDMFERFVKTFKKSTLPDSISILINYGTEDSHILFDASGNRQGCSEVQVWDPFSEFCRDVHCSADMDLVEYDCENYYGNETW